MMQQPSAEHAVFFGWDLHEFDHLVENYAYDKSLSALLPYLRRRGSAWRPAAAPVTSSAYLANIGYDEGRVFSPIWMGRALNAVFGLRPLLHNHMHTIIARKVPPAS